jgi:hypothetical protein
MTADLRPALSSRCERLLIFAYGYCGKDGVAQSPFSLLHIVR